MCCGHCHAVVDFTFAVYVTVVHFLKSVAVFLIVVAFIVPHLSIKMPML